MELVLGIVSAVFSCIAIILIIFESRQRFLSEHQNSCKQEESPLQRENYWTVKEKDRSMEVELVKDKDGVYRRS